MRYSSMASTLRDLLLQRAARLQDRPALSTPDWGTLSYAQLRNRAEGVALGLMAGTPPPVLHRAAGSAWDWVAELAAAASGLGWASGGAPVPPEVLGGPRFNDEAGRGPYHAREQVVRPDTPFAGPLTHGDLLTQLRRLNRILGWDHDTRADLPLARLGEPALRAALWSLLYAGGHAVLGPEPPRTQSRVGNLLGRLGPALPPWDESPFAGFWEPDSPAPWKGNPTG